MPVLKADLQQRATDLGLSTDGTKADLEARIAAAEAAAAVAATDRRGRVRKALDASVKAATHLTVVDFAVVEAARALADKIDAWDVIVEWALEDAAETESRPKVPQNDNVSLASFLKYCQSLGLAPDQRKERPTTTATPGTAARKKSERPSEPEGGAGDNVGSVTPLAKFLAARGDRSA